MLDLRYGRRWQAASLLLLIFVLGAASMPAVWFWGDKTAGIRWFDGADKWLHGITFAVLALWFSGLYRKRSYWKIGLGLLLFGFCIELCQRLVGYRTADALDIGADAAGIVVGLGIAMAGAGGWCLRAERRLAKR